MRVLIVGAGIGGTGLAIALRRRGISAQILESRASAQPTGGAFLALSPNGSTALSAIGFDGLVAEAGGFAVTGMDFYNASGRRIADIDGRDDQRRFGAFTTVVRRGLLNERLAARAVEDGATIRFDARVTAITESEDSVSVRLVDGTDVVGDVLVGADGIWSTVRQTTWPTAEAPRYSGIIDCGGWTPVDLPDTARQQMHFGRRAFFGYTVRDGVAYWFTNVPQERAPLRRELDDLDRDVWMDHIRELHVDGTDDIRTILAADALRSTEHPSTDLLGAWPLYDLPSPTEWTTDRIALLGDAIHATSPSTGQGASLAIEDAVVLAAMLDTAATPQDALAWYVAERRRRAEKIVAFGRQIGHRKIASAASNVFRDLTLPGFLRLGSKQTAEQYAYSFTAPESSCDTAWPARPGLLDGVGGLE